MRQTDNIRDSDAIFCEKRVSTDGATPTVAVSGSLASSISYIS